MPKRNSKDEVFRMLVDKQLEPYDKTIDDVKGEEEWYLKYTTTEEKGQEFYEWGVELIRKKLKLSKSRAKNEMNWFILGYGLKIENYDSKN